MERDRERENKENKDESITMNKIKKKIVWFKKKKKFFLNFENVFVFFSPFYRCKTLLKFFFLPELCSLFNGLNRKEILKLVLKKKQKKYKKYLVVDD